jgi:hypothetical protein
MPDNSTAAGTTAPEAGTGTAPGPQGTGTAQPQDSGTAQGSPAPHDNAQAKGDDKVAKELAAAQARIAELEAANLSESERKDRRLAELEAAQTAWELERQTLTLRHAAFQAAVKAGAVYPDLVVNAISPASVEWGKDGDPTNLDKVVADARQAYPNLFRVTPGQVDGGAGTGAPAGAPDMNDLIRRGAGRTS